MKENYAVLIIEDHPMVANVYKMAFEQVAKENSAFEFTLSFAKDCESANAKLDLAAKGDGYDIIFLDINLPPAIELNILSGEDLGIKIRKTLPDVKIMVSTTYYDEYRIHSIIKSIDPDAFLVKNDFDDHALKDAIVQVIQRPPYYSYTVLKCFRNRVVNEYVLDQIDRQMLHELSMGAKMKELPKIIPMSMAGLEKRKRQMKEILNIPDMDDRSLIIVAKQKGFI